MVDVAQLVRALVCGTKGRGFESHLHPLEIAAVLVFRDGFLLNATRLFSIVAIFV